MKILSSFSIVAIAGFAVVGDIDSHSSLFSLLSSTQKSQALGIITSSIAEIRAVSPTSLDAVDQTSQVEVIAVLTEFQKYL